MGVMLTLDVGVTDPLGIIGRCGKRVLVPEARPCQAKRSISVVSDLISAGEPMSSGSDQGHHPRLRFET